MAEPDSVRASDSERDAAASRLQAAFAEGRLGDTEFDERMRAALTARTRTDLARLTTDLPAEAPAPLPDPAGRRPGRIAVTFKSSLRRAGRWRVPERLTTVVYKGEGLLDLRAAELTAPVTTISAPGFARRARRTAWRDFWSAVAVTVHVFTSTRSAPDARSPSTTAMPRSRSSRAADSISDWLTLQPRLTIAAERGRASITTARASWTSGSR